jgi:hypothetical protein
VTRRAVLLFGFLVAGVPLVATAGDARHAVGSDVRLTLSLLEPADGAVWTAGETATIAWEPGEGFDRLDRIEEWEVFLSVDDGATFPVRLTPHLDFSRRSVEVAVPELISAKGRLLFRVGDERIERSIPTSVRLRIVAGPGPTAPSPTRRLSLTPGEPVRPGAAPVLYWAEGDRSGAAAWREREASIPRRPTFESAFRAHPVLWILSPPPESRAAISRGVERLGDFAVRSAVEAPAAFLGRHARPILLWIVRRNE